MTRIQYLAQEYLKIVHSIQCAIDFDHKVKMNEEGEDKSWEPKHLRVGIDTTKAEDAGLAVLLIKKGVITEEEYYQAMLDGVKKELEIYERKYPGVKFV